jgi:hypothetical protein
MPSNIEAGKSMILTDVIFTTVSGGFQISNLEFKKYKKEKKKIKVQESLLSAV